MKPGVLLAALLSGAALAGEARPYTRNVAVVLYDGVEILDFAGPTEVFQAAGGFARKRDQRAFRVYTVAAEKGPLRSQDVVTVLPEFTFADAPAPDIIVIPGGSGSTLFSRADFQSWLKHHASRAEVTLTVCTGAFALARIGALDGLDATTWYNQVENLQKAAPKARVIPGRRPTSAAPA